MAEKELYELWRGDIGFPVRSRQEFQVRIKNVRIELLPQVKEQRANLAIDKSYSSAWRYFWVYHVKNPERVAKI